MKPFRKSQGLHSASDSKLPNQQYPEVFASSVQDFLTYTKDIQNDLDSLLGFGGLSPSSVSHELWEFIDEMLRTYEFGSLKFTKFNETSYPDLQNLAEAFVKVLSEYAKLKEKAEVGCLTESESFNSPDSLFSENEDSLLYILDLEDPKQVLPKVKEMKRVVEAAPLMEEFIEDVCEELFPGTVNESSFESYLSSMRRAVDKIAEMNQDLGNFLDFKEKLCWTLEVPLESTEKAIIREAKFVKYFKDLFEVQPEEDIFGVMEQIFLFVNETRVFIQKAKHIQRLKTSLGVSDVYKQVLRTLLRFRT